MQSPCLNLRFPSSFDTHVSRWQGEFLEMTGMRVTEAQASRLWGLDAATFGPLMS